MPARRVQFPDTDSEESLFHRISITVAVLVLGLVPRLHAYGESVRTLPNWEERVIHQLMNRARVNPAAELIPGCGANCSAAELAPTCYTPVAPLPQVFSLNHAARFHSESMGRNNFFDHVTPFVIRSDIASVYPESCNGSASCAGSGAGTTQPNIRVGRFGGSYAGEIIAVASSPHAAFYQGWLYEAAPTTTPCGFTIPNGHRWLILKSGPAVGTGFAFVPGSQYGLYYTGDFGAGPAIPKIPSGSHWGAAGSSSPNGRQSSSVEFWTNWYDAAPPMQATVVVDNVPSIMTLARGSSTNGAWVAVVNGLENGCHRYYFSFQDSTGQTVRYPNIGTLGVGPAGSCADWSGSIRSDFNGDGKSDMALRNSATGDIAEWQMNGLTIAGGAVIGNPGVNYTLRTLGDYNGDGKADITLQSTAGDIAIWLMNGNTITAGAVVGNPGPGWIAAGSGDVNADGKWDIILHQASTGNVAVWQMNGTVITGGAVLGGPGTGWSVVGVGDFNGDGKADILLQNSSTSTIAEWQLNGLTISAAAVISAPGAAWVVKDAADVSGDGRADILLRNQTSRNIAVWHMNGFTVTAGFDLGSPSVGYDLVGSADFNGDGKSDALLRDTSGNVAIWLLDGDSITSGAVVGSPGSSYTPTVK